MMRRTRRRVPLVLTSATALLAGCSSMKPGLGFDQVRDGVSERTGMKLHWNNGTQADQEAADAVAAMLGRPLTADAAVQTALLNNHELQAVYEDLNIAQADLVDAGLLRNPVFSAEVRWPTVGAGSPGIVLDLALDFVGLFSMPLRKGRAEAAFEAAKLRVTARVVDTAAEVRTAFYDYVAAEQTLDMRRTVVDATRASHDLARRLRAAGNIRDLDVLNEQDLFEQATIDLAMAEEEVAQARERLNSLMGVWGNQTRWHAEPMLAPIPEQDDLPEDPERVAIERSLDLSIARRDIEVAARTLGIVKPFGWLSDAEVGAAAERDVGGDWSVGPSVSVPVPIFDQGQGRVGSARAQLRQATERYYAGAVEVRSRVRAARSALVAARDRARLYQQVLLPLRQQIVDQTQLQYNAMQVSAFQLLEAKRNQIDAGARYIAALHDFWVARTRIEQVLSGRLAPYTPAPTSADTTPRRMPDEPAPAH